MQAASARVRIAGLAVALDVEGPLDAFDLGVDPREALAILSAGCAATHDDPMVACSVRVVAHEAPEPNGACSFFHGGVRVHQTPAGWLLRDLRCWVEVDVHKRHVSACIAPGRHHLAGFFRTTIFVALVLLFRHLRRFHIHAGLVAREQQVWLIVGPSGSGKSTTTLSLRRAGFHALADDAVFLSTEGAYPVARPFHITPRTSAAFPEITPSGKTELGKLEARIAIPSDVVRMPTGFIFLAGPHAQTHVALLDPSDALGLLVESSALLIVDGAGEVEAQMHLLGSWVTRIPSVRLEAGPEWLLRAREDVLIHALAR